MLSVTLAVKSAASVIVPSASAATRSAKSLAKPVMALTPVASTASDVWTSKAFSAPAAAVPVTVTVIASVAAVLRSAKLSTVPVANVAVTTPSVNAAMAFSTTTVGVSLMLAATAARLTN